MVHYVDAIHIRQVQIQGHQVIVAQLQQFQRRLASCRAIYVVMLAGQQRTEDFRSGLIILHDQQMRLVFYRLDARGRYFLSGVLAG